MAPSSILEVADVVPTWTLNPRRLEPSSGISVQPLNWQSGIPFPPEMRPFWQPWTSPSPELLQPPLLSLDVPSERDVSPSQRVLPMPPLSSLPPLFPSPPAGSAASPLWDLKLVMAEWETKWRITVEGYVWT